MERDSKVADRQSIRSTNDDLPTEEELAPVVLKGVVDPVYEGKAQVLNSAIQGIGMGKYQWQLFIVVGGFGWASDNLWPIVTSLILKPVALEFNATRPPLLSLSQNIGLLVGAIFWGFGCTAFRYKEDNGLTSLRRPLWPSMGFQFDHWHHLSLRPRCGRIANFCGDWRLRGIVERGRWGKSPR